LKALAVGCVPLLVLAACGDSPTGPRAGIDYMLATANGIALPAAIDSAPLGPNTNIVRITDGAIEFISADSAVYVRASELLLRDANGAVLQEAATCESRRVAYMREGSRVVLHADAFTLPPSQGGSMVPALDDTLEVSGNTLRRTITSQLSGTPRPVQLEYRTGRRSQPLC